MTNRSTSADFKFSNKISNIKHLVPFYGQFMLLSMQILAHNIYFDLKSKARFGVCPLCQQESRHHHSQYIRYLQDTPMHTHQVVLRLHMHKYYCKNKACVKKVFAESTHITERYARNTPNADKQITDLIRNCSSVTCSNQLKLQGIYCSPNTCYRKLLKLPIPVFKGSFIGIDDFAYKKGNTYGTVVVDQITHTPVDLFKGRDTLSVEAWFKNHPEIKVVTRDGGLCFKKAISNTSNKIEQIRDRFHLMQDFSLYIERLIKRILDKQEWQTNSILPEEEDIRKIIWEHIIGMGIESQRSKNKRHIDIHDLYSKGFSIPEIAEKVKVNSGNINRYLRTQITKHFSDEQRAIYKHIQEISLLFSQGKLTNAHDIAEQYKDIDYKLLFGLDKKIMAYAEVLNRDNKKKYKEKTKKPSRKIIFNTFFLEGYITTHKSLSDVLYKNESYRKLIKLCHHFRELMNQSNAPYTLRQWMAAAVKLKIREITNFVKMISFDLEAVENAVETPLNNGLLEGTVNKIKMIKRIMYGRASFKLLKVKVLLQSTT